MYPRAEVVALVTLVQSQHEMGRASGSGEPAPWVSRLARGASTPPPLEVALGSPPSRGNVSPQPEGWCGGLKTLPCLLQERKVTSMTIKSRERFLMAEW